ncbi:tetratricopeptide repeat protein [Marinobacter sp. CHS3-4]|uniref:tetratricopeptide repeat protein n=1 Tax=Marinobacter sp. CHS3-4 TaxID=3045174 RepID=UPI0024B50454|nr:tetratricopeptide repeat protein [Marinobacter sp. CHS3-4]MDI9245739.1 tetratricopeptide repeat protein [Marinobacter sp. CHS3-4]
MTSGGPNPRLRSPATGLLVFVLALTGCQATSGLFSGGGPDEPRPGTLAALNPAELPEDSSFTDASAEVSRADVMKSYQDLLPLLQDPAKRVEVRHRLADLEFERAENELVDNAVDEMEGAIEAYQALLAEYPNRETNDRILYQLARAYGLRGMRLKQLEALDRLVEAYPDSEFWLESQFRRGDILFREDRYAEAEQAFRTVIDSDPSDSRRESFLVNAQFMQGWSQFKQGDFRDALQSYMNVLDLVMPGKVTVADVDQQYQTLTEDLFRVFGLSLSYLNGADTLQALFEEAGEKSYEILVYDRYSKLLLEREQYSDAISVYERYIESRPFSPWAPRYHIRIIDTLRTAGFTSTINDRKAEFVSDYGYYSAYWPQADEETLDFIQQQLEGLIPELANRQYALATDSTGEKAREHYLAAADYYEEFADTFPTHPKTPEMLFLLGESRLALEQWPEAIAAFERVAYDFPYEGDVPERAREAGYASVLAYREFAKTWPKEPEEDYRNYAEFQQMNRLRFANAFPLDPRADDVLFTAVQYRFEQQGYPTVVELSEQLIARQPRPSLSAEAKLLKAHSLFELGRYADAELAYQEALLDLPAEDERRAGLTENLAASVFRQAEALADAGKTAEAVSEFLRVGVVAPSAALTANAQYDAATLLMELNHWQDAIDVMIAFRSDYPNHEQIDTLPAKLALAYRETEQWEKAGDELNQMFAMATTDTERRENLLIAAELYERAGNLSKAIDTYRRYANTYPQPRDVFMESAKSLSNLYRETGDDSRRRYWLREQMAAVDQAPDQADDRMRYLAAEAAATLAREKLETYNAISLTLPLSESMRAKTSALEEAVEAYKKTASYGVSSFSTEAGYQIAHIYGRLGKDLMDSERPEGLSELEMAQYELLLEEQAFPFEDNAIRIHEQNASRTQSGIYDEWVKRSFEALKRLLPGRYDKPELLTGVVDELG